MNYTIMFTVSSNSRIYVDHLGEGGYSWSGSCGIIMKYEGSVLNEADIVLKGFW